MKTLQVIQANVGKGGSAHDIILSLAHDNRSDIVLIQEPWIHQEKSRRISKKHPSDAFSLIRSILALNLI
jgi:hypothetical protein